MESQDVKPKAIIIEKRKTKTQKRNARKWAQIYRDVPPELLSNLKRKRQALKNYLKWKKAQGGEKTEDIPVPEDAAPLPAENDASLE